MIWQLMREQMRAQRRYVAWTAALLTLTMAFASYGTMVLATQYVVDTNASTALGYDRASHAFAYSWHNPHGSELVEPGYGENTLEEVDAAVAQAIAGGSDVVALRDFYGSSLGTDEMYSGAITAVAGDFDWSLVLVSGDPPQSGQIAISSTVAIQRGLEVGDVISIKSWDWNERAVIGKEYGSIDLEISGFIRSATMWGTYHAPIAEAYVAWEDSERILLATEYSEAYGEPEELYGLHASTTFAWNDGHPALQELVLEPHDPWWGFSGANSVFSWLSLLLAVILILAMITMAFAVGRSQAQARLHWVATARTLGAKRSVIAAATVLETVVVGVVAGVAGGAIGVTVAAVELAHLHQTIPNVFLPSAISFPWYAGAGLAGLAILVAVAVGAVPAFWASRVSPVAALKPVNDVTEAEVSRRLPVRWIVAIWAVAVSGVLFVNEAVFALPSGDIIMGLLLCVVAVLSFVVAQESFRWLMPLLGRRLARSRRPWALAAGDAIAARPRQAAVPALIMAIVTIPWVGIAAVQALQWHETQAWNSSEAAWFAYSDFSGATDLFHLQGAGSMFAVVTLIALAIHASAGGATAVEGATRAALGLTQGARRAATAVQFAVPLTTGLVAGLVVAMSAVVTLYSSVLGSDDAEYYDDMGLPVIDTAWVIGALPATMVPVGLLVALGAACIAIATGVVAASTSRRTPVEDLARV